MPTQQKYCPTCGSASLPDASFCMSCGNKFPLQPQTAPIPTAPVPTPPLSDFITLSCPNCGGKLQLTADIERFACQFCGHEHIVRRGGGAVSLEPVVKVMQNIDASINLVGSGVNRLGFSSEKQAAEQTIARLKTELAAIQKEQSDIDSSAGVVGAVLSILFAICFVFLVLAAVNGWSIIVWLILLPLAVLCVFGMISIFKGDKSTAASIKQRMASKQAELEQNYRIARGE